MSNYEISKSSLLSLKAEILRKQEDLSKAKLENAEKIKSIKKKTPLELKNKGVEDRGLKDLDQEDQDLLKLSKSKLEVKSRLYEKLSYSSHKSEELNNRYLVQFDKKDKHLGPMAKEDLPVESEDEKHYFSDEYDEAVDPSEEWVEYTDCLGRTRKCLRKDLEYMKSKEANLIAAKTPTEPERLEKLEEKPTIDEKEKTTDHNIQSHVSSEDLELLSGDMKREMLRQQWEKEEDELRDKTNIYYQNVLFNEARQHGVGYYAFSKDEEERIKQQEALKKLRVETEQKQKKAQDLKAMRERQMAARIKAARNRRRARLGLPPEEDEAVPSSESTKDLEEEKRKKEEQEKAEEIEKLLLEARKRHVRPWDIGKDGISEHYEMTQNEWNEKQRQDRIKEFAPPKTYSSRAFSSKQSLEPTFEENNKSLHFSSKKNRDYKLNKQNSKSLNPYKNNNDNIGKAATNYIDDSNDSLLEAYKLVQSSAAATRGRPNSHKNRSYEPSEPTSDDENDNLLKDYKSFSTSIPAMKPVPIINELEETNFDDRLLSHYNNFMQETLCSEENTNREENSLRNRGIEIAPPPIFEYYGPGESKRAKTSPGKKNISESIEAGLKFLRKQADKKGRHCVDQTEI